MAARATGNHLALEIASMHGAMFLGMDDDIGSITVGKLADLMVLNANPLENIRNTADIRYVMKSGRCTMRIRSMSCGRDENRTEIVTGFCPRCSRAT